MLQSIAACAATTSKACNQTPSQFVAVAVKPGPQKPRLRSLPSASLNAAFELSAAVLGLGTWPTSDCIEGLDDVCLHFDVLEGPAALSVKSQDQLVMFDDGTLVRNGEQRDTQTCARLVDLVRDVI